MSTGQGFILLDIITILAVFFAGLCQLAIYMDRYLVETETVTTARMLMFIGYLIIGFRWTFLFFNSDMDLRITPMLLVGVLLTAVAQIMLAADRLLHGNRKEKSDEPSPSEA